MAAKLSSWFNRLSGPKKLVAGMVAVVAAIGTVVGAVNGSIALYEKLTAQAREASNLELVDVSFGTPEDPYEPVLDIKVMNTGGNAAVIKRADIKARKIWTLVPPYSGDVEIANAYLDSSYKYEITLPLRGAPYTIPRSLSQSVDAGEVDRFQIALNPRLEESKRDYVFLLTVSLIYDADGKGVSKDVVFAAPDETDLQFYNPDAGYGPTVGLSKEEAAELAEQNEQSISEIRGTKAPKYYWVDNLSKAISQP